MPSDNVAIEFKSYTKPSEFIDDLEARIAGARSRLKELEGRIDSLREKADILDKLSSLLASPQVSHSPSMFEAGLAGAKLLVNPTPSQELEVLEYTVSRLKAMIAALESVLSEVKALEGLGDVGLVLDVVYENGIPTKILLKI
ncbi:MAG: hypothetical protein F7C38_00940 [Desulfurococcales archaeon]|nr:hypothetical protein [Desulfurococcales archaeon]